MIDAVITRRCALLGADFYLLQDMPERHVWWYCYGRLTLSPGTILDRPDTMSIRAHYGPLLYSRNILLLDEKDICGAKREHIVTVYSNGLEVTEVSDSDSDLGLYSNVDEP